jgi:hypothetical protein
LSHDIGFNSSIKEGPLELNEVKTSKEFTAPMANTEIPSAGTAI